ncbi:MAG: crotonase/enoyl-CoA hydratase family protein [Rhizobiaceae bacterium]|nr:crotonase/enoyl-CoA hydratase family protein [Rhizobiaceae bacterium]
MALVMYELSGDVAVLTLNRPDKRNAISDALIAELSDAVDRAASEAKAGVICANGDHFCAGLDLSEQSARDLVQGIAGSRSWHAVFAKMQRGSVPYVAALKGAVIGGGLELVAAAHIRVAEPDTFFAMPEGQRGIFVGGGGSVNITRLIGVARMTDMMLTGRSFDAGEGERIGAVNYLASAGGGFDKAMELARAIAGNAPLSNYVTINALQRIHDSGYDEGLFFETMIATLTQTTSEAVERMRAFVEKRADRLKLPEGAK